MIKKSLLRSFKQNQIFMPLYKFGAGSTHVTLETRNLLENVDINKNMVPIFGFKEAHDHPHVDETDPYAHLRNKPFFSFERYCFSDPYYVPDENEPLMNEPHGYITNDDPMDQRNQYDASQMFYTYLFGIGLSITCFLGFNSVYFRGAPTEIFEANLTAEMIEDKIRLIRVENQHLVQRKAELIEKLSAE